MTTGNTTLEQIAAELRPDYDASAAGSDLAMMAQMMMAGREELALTCLNRANAYLWKLANTPPARTAWTAVTTRHGSTIGLSTENVRGYAPLKDHSGLIFDRHDDAQQLADQLNIATGHTLEEAHEIVVSSMTASA